LVDYTNSYRINEDMAIDKTIKTCRRSIHFDPT